MSEFAWPTCTVFRGPALVGTYPVTVTARHMEWPHVIGDPLVGTFDGLSTGDLWEVHEIENRWYAAPSVPIESSSGRWTPRVDLGAAIQQWPMLASWHPPRDAKVGFVAVDHRGGRSPIYWHVYGKGPVGHDATVWELAPEDPTKSVPAVQERDLARMLGLAESQAEGLVETLEEATSRLGRLKWDEGLLVTRLADLALALEHVDVAHDALSRARRVLTRRGWWVWVKQSVVGV